MHGIGTQIAHFIATFHPVYGHCYTVSRKKQFPIQFNLSQGQNHFSSAETDLWQQSTDLQTIYNFFLMP